MAKFIDRLLYTFGRKSLYDLHPELQDRVPIQRVWADEADRPAAEYSSALQDYERNIWVHKAVKIIADNVAPLPVNVVRGRPGDVVEGHQFALLLDEVNESMAASDLWKEWSTQLMLGGECGFELTKGERSGRYMEIWPREGAHYSVRVDKARRRYGGVVGYRVDDQQGAPYDLEPDEFIHFKFYNPSNKWRGLAPIRAVAMGVLIDQLAQAWSRLFFKNSARPDMAIISPTGMTSKERDELLGKFETRYGGFEQAHKVVVLEEGVTDIKSFSHPPKDIEWLEQRKLSREEILSIFGVPPEVAGIGPATYENLFNAQRVLWLFTLKPLIGFRDDQLTEWGKRVKVIGPQERIRTDLSGVEVLQADLAEMATTADTIWSMGVPFKDINERLGMGFPRFKGDDVGYIPFSLIPAGSVSVMEEGTQLPPRQQAMAAWRVLGMLLTEDKIEVQPLPQLKAAADRIPFNGETHKAMWLLFKAKTESRERLMKRLLKKAFQAEQEDVIKTMRSYDAPAAIDRALVFAKEARKEAWVQDFQAYFKDTLAEGGQHGIDQVGVVQRGMKQEVGVAFDLNNPIVLQVVNDILWRFAEEINDTTWGELAALMDEALAEGWTIPKLADRISELYVGFKGYRSEMIARTETIKLYNGGAYLGYEQAGIEKRAWMSALDHRTRDAHIEAHAQERFTGEPFDVGGEPMMYPGGGADPANNINCRCTTVPVVE